LALREIAESIADENEDEGCDFPEKANITETETAKNLQKTN
jgi:hypothetical protein